MPGRPKERRSPGSAQFRWRSVIETQTNKPTKPEDVTVSKTNYENQAIPVRVHHRPDGPAGFGRILLKGESALNLSVRGPHGVSEGPRSALDRLVLEVRAALRLRTPG